MTYFNFAQGGTAPNNPDGVIYPQRIYQNAVPNSGKRLLHAAAHMDSCRYSVWRMLDFGCDGEPNCSLGDWYSGLTEAGTPFAIDDEIGTNAIPHMSIVHGL